MSDCPTHVQPALSERLPIVTYTNRFSEPAETLWMSAQVERLFGYRLDEWLRNPGFLESILHPDDRPSVRAAMHALREHLHPFSRDYRLLRGDGEVVWIHDESVALVDDEGRPQFIQGYFIDITARKRLEDALQHAQKVEAVGRLAAGIAHDVNNLLSAIAGFTELAERKVDEGHPARRYLADIAATVQRGVRLTRQLLTFSRREELRPAVVGLAGAIGGIEAMLLHVAGPAVHADFEVPDDIRVFVDTGRFEQVLLNLVENAREAMPDGGRLTIRASVADVPRGVEAERLGIPPGRYAAITVQDTGVGMDAATRARIFEPFFTTKPRDAGTGLGLATVHGIVRQSGGAVDVSSIEGHGTTVRVLLPLAGLG
jgi:PAS domain S-box-containing protein